MKHGCIMLQIYIYTSKEINLLHILIIFLSTIFRTIYLFSLGGAKMTEIEELVKLILPALKEFFNTQNISDNKQKQLDKVQNPSIACIKEDIEND